MKQQHSDIICTYLQLGNPTGFAIKVTGGLLHNMWRVNTGNESYAIKQLSPHINLNNQKIISNYELTETIADQFSKQGIPAVTALSRLGKHLIIIDSTGYLVYPWLEARALGSDEISDAHRVKIAEILAKMRSIKLQISEIENPLFDTHTNLNIIKAIEKASSLQCLFAKDLIQKQSMILEMNDQYLSAIALLKEQSVISHGDLDPKNVLWDKSDQPILIDWESARKLNPTYEIVNTSLDWSGIITDKFSLPSFSRMLQAYVEAGGDINQSHLSPALYGVIGNWLNWMLYNIERSCTSGDVEQREIGIEQVNQVLITIMRLHGLIPELISVGGVL